MRPNMEHFLSGNRGIYIPQNFAQIINRPYWKVNTEDLEILEKGPDGEFYWETWEDVLDSAIFTDPDTKAEYYLYQDDDLWLIPVGYSFDDFAE